MREYGYERSMEIFSPEEMREVLKNPGYLPTREEISYAFTGNKDAINQSPKEALDDDSFDEKEWEKEFAMHVMFNEFCNDKENQIYEFFNEEYINDLSTYLAERIKISATTNEPITILEVGAGGGRLTHFLKQKLDEIIPGKYRMTATDSGEWEIKTAFPVEKMSHDEALEKYRPQIVIFSWMPHEEDYTTDFRSAKSVEEYLLIGEEDCCGDSELSWRSYYETTSDDPPYQKEIFKKNELKDVSKNQFCRTDYPSQNRKHSRTVSFRREHVQRTPVDKKKPNTSTRRQAPRPQTNRPSPSIS